MNERNRRSNRPRPRVGLCLAWVLGASAPALTAGPMSLQARAGGGVLRVSDADASVSDAVRTGPGLESKFGGGPLTQGGYRVHARVLARDADAIALKRACEGVACRVASHPSVAGWTVIDCVSIREAEGVRGRLLASGAASRAELDVETPRALRTVPTDPAFAQQWHLVNTLMPNVDLNVEPAWSSGITGQGVTVGIVEGGWQTSHPDLAGNFDALASTPGGSSVSHATSCAGLVGASANNGMGGVGVAYGARVSNLVYGAASATAAALTFRNDLNQIKSNSWGPPDLGILADASAIELDALRQGATTGRGGLGTVYCWAAGNGGPDDRVDYDPYASSRFTVAVGAIGDQDTRADYAEPGSSVFVVAPSSGNVRPVFSTANQSGYDPDFGGTSATCPIGAGVVALMLSANPSLSVRDVQHVLARSARRCDPDDPSWEVNGGGLWVHPFYGFGAIDASAAVTLAQGWTPVAPAVEADTGTIAGDVPIPDFDPAGVAVPIFVRDRVRAEHVELVLDATTTYVGDLRITLVSPSGTESVFAEPRDDPQDDLDGRVFMTVRCWDEPAQGLWTLRISDEGPLDLATLHGVRLIVHGTPIRPVGCSEADLAEPFGVLNYFDISAFVTLYLARDPAADLTGDGIWNFFDLTRFVGSYGQGCPP